MDRNPKNKYCFDSSALIQSWRDHYRPNSFKPLWDRIGGMIEEEIILIPNEVRREVGAGNDELVLWLKQYASRIIPISKEQVEVVSEIVNKYQMVSQYNKPRPYHADPFVVALGKITSSIVVTYETPGGNPLNPKIPSLCKEFGVKWCNFNGFFENEGWTFEVK